MVAFLSNIMCKALPFHILQSIVIAFLQLEKDSLSSKNSRNVMKLEFCGRITARVFCFTFLEENVPSVPISGIFPPTGTLIASFFLLTARRKPAHVFFRNCKPSDFKDRPPCFAVRLALDSQLKMNSLYYGPILICFQNALIQHAVNNIPSASETY